MLLNTKRNAKIKNSVVLIYALKFPIYSAFNSPEISLSILYPERSISDYSFLTKKKNQLFKVFWVYKKLSLESYFSLAPFPSFYASRWQVIAKIDNVYKNYNMVFSLQRSYKFSLLPWSPGKGSIHPLSHLFTSYLENIITYVEHVY